MMNSDTLHRRSRDPRDGGLRAAGVMVTLAGALAAALGLQVAGEGLQQRLGGVFGRPSSGPSVLSGTPATCPAAPNGSAARPAHARALASWHAGVMPAI